MKQYVMIGIGIIFLLEMIYFNILYDYIIVLILVALSLAFGSYVPLRIRRIDTVLVKIALGLGGISFFIWLMTFYDVHLKSVFILCSIVLIFLKRKNIYRDIKDIYRFTNKLMTKNIFLVIVLICGIIFYTIVASYPITQWDSLAKHIVIPSKILNYGYYDYNIIESVIFGDYAILVHMLYLFLLALGGTKALVLLNVLISFLTLLAILRIVNFITKSKYTLSIISLIYLSTPLISMYSTTLCVDLYPVFFIAIALLLIQYDKSILVQSHLPLIALLFGFAFFSKQMAFYMIVPISLYIIYLLRYQFKKMDIKFYMTLVFSIFLFCVPFLPVMIVIWYKTGNPLFPFLNGVFQSPYFLPTNFQDPYTVWQRFLGFDLQSLISIVFNTSRNTEYNNGGAGLHLLLIPLAIIVWPLLLRNRRYFILIFATLASYWISVTFFNPNIRYFTGAIIFAIPSVVLALEAIVNKLKYSYIRKTVVLIVTIVFVGFNLSVIFKENNYLGLKKIMLKPDSRLTLALSEDILAGINRSNIYLLANNENLRGTYKGHFYTLTWYNTFFISKLTSGEISPVNFLMNFDYYLINKMIPLKQENHFSLDNSEINNTLELVSETNTHKLFKVKKTYEVLSEEKFSESIIANVSNPKVIYFVHKDTKAYKISLDVMPTTSKLTMGRFQINWVDEKGKFVGTSLSVFELKDQQKALYTSNTIVDIPETATAGHLYLTGHTEEQIKFFGYKLERQSDNHLIKNELKKYGQKLMPTYTSKIE